MKQLKPIVPKFLLTKLVKSENIFLVQIVFLFFWIRRLIVLMCQMWLVGAIIIASKIASTVLQYCTDIALVPSAGV